MSKIQEAIQQMSVEEMKQRLASYMATPMVSVSTTTSVAPRKVDTVRWKNN